MSEPLEEILSLYQHENREIANVDEPQCSIVLFKQADKNFAFYGSQIKRFLPSALSHGCRAAHLLLKG